MNKYQSGKIYQIVCNTTNLVFYGSTTEPNINRKLAGHKANLKKDNKNDISYKVLENNNYKMNLVEEYVCNSKEELLNREQYYIKNNECINEKKSNDVTILDIQLKELCKQNIKNEATCKSNISSVKRIAKECFKTDTLTLEVLKQYKQYDKYINELQPNVGKCLSNCMKNVIKLLDIQEEVKEHYQNTFNLCANVATEKRDTAEATEKQTDKYCSWDSILKIRDNLKTKINDKYAPHIDINYVLVSLYTYIPPLRQTDYVNAKVYLDDVRTTIL